MILKLVLLINSIDMPGPFYFTKNRVSFFNYSINYFVGYWKKKMSDEFFIRACLTFVIFFYQLRYDLLKYFYVNDEYFDGEKSPLSTYLRDFILQTNFTSVW